MTNWKNTVLALSLLSLAGLPAVAQDSNTAQTDSAGATANASAEAQARDKSDQVLEDAIAALQETGNAIKALQDDKTDDAIAALERAIGKLEVTLTDNPDLSLAPVDVATSVIDVAATPDEIRNMRNQALRLMKDHQLQLARGIITGLASEVDVSTTYIPLATYPLALKSATALIKDGQKDTALEVLGNALNTLVVVDTVLPLPLLNAQVLIDEARKLSAKADRTEDENARLASLLDALDAQIDRGEALEYGGAGAFDDIRAEMKEIRRATSNGGSGEGIFDKLKNLFRRVGSSHSAATQK